MTVAIAGQEGLYDLGWRADEAIDLSMNEVHRRQPYFPRREMPAS
jgi:hypothetical protein